MSGCFLNSVQYGFYQSVNRILVARIGFFNQPVGYDHAYRGRLMSHQAAQTGQCGAFHLEVRNAIAIVFKVLDLFILLRVGQRNA